ncbi:MAG: tRNA dimethylallyltransferase [Lentimonas sp.]|jgi:tRNA dimethylallyltransferase
MVKDKKILIISGATASGKSALALETAIAKNGVVINADSMQLYEELPILSAQPAKEDQAQAPHFLYSALKHNQNSSLALWLEMVIKEINWAFEGEKLPIIVGGTGLYLSKLIDGINEIPQIDENLRLEMRQLAENSTREELVEMLKDLGEEKIENLDKQRLTRRLEVLKQTGKSLSWWQDQPNKVFYPKECFEHINVNLPRDELYRNCDERMLKMFENGALKEVEELISQNPDDNSLITKTIGFLEIKDYLQGNMSKEETINLASQKTRNYAKRQLTWFRNQFSF